MADILSHSGRRRRLHIITLDDVLAQDVYERIHSDERMKYFGIVRPSRTGIKQGIEELDSMAQDTVTSSLLIIDVRRFTLPKLKNVYNKIVGYNRKDFNRTCHTILISDGPVNLLQSQKPLEAFIGYLSQHRADFHTAVFFFDPFLHYETSEIDIRQLNEDCQLPQTLPKRFRPYFQKSEKVTVKAIRRYFRATDKSNEIRATRMAVLRDLYRIRIQEEFGHNNEQIKALLSSQGIQLTTERLNLYPLFFEDWVCELMQKSVQG